MANRVCQKCGEEYSDTYRRCPFCEEEEALKKGHPLHRHNGGKRLDKRRHSNGGVGGVLLLLTCFIILGVLVYVFWGDRIADTMGIRADPTQLGFGESDGEEPPEEPSEPQGDEPVQPVSLLVISQSAMTLSVGETALLTVSGVEGDVIWTSSDEQIAVVSDGTVTGKAGGTATITAEVAGEIAICNLQINGDPPADDSPAAPDTPSSNTTTTLSLNKSDFTLRSDDPPVQMKVKGTDSKVTWASKDTNVVTVSDSGVVTRVGAGQTTVTASVDGQVLECIVRVR